MTERLMKDSGVEWIGAIPEDWNIDNIGSLYKERKEKCSDTEYPPLSVTMQGIVPQLSTAAKTDAHDDRKLVRKGDFAINSRSDRRGSCGISPQDGSVSLINTVLIPREEMNPGYYGWLFRSEMFSSEFYKWGHGIVDDLWTTNWQDMKSISVPVPLLQEQARIADFLDKKVSEIDAVISKTKESIEEYKKLKQSIITEAVTKGLDPNVEMKDSGVEWVGEIPRGWKKIKLKYLVNIKGRIGFRGYTEQDLVESGEGAITLSPSNFKDMKMNYSKCSYISWEKYFESPEIMVGNGDVLLVKTGSTYGKASIVHNLPMEATINPQLVILKSKGCNNKWLSYFLQTKYFDSLTELAVVGGTIPTMSQEKIGNFEIIAPAENDQEAIVEYLENRCLKYDTLISKKEEIITNLEQYKKSLIYECVTGKREVPYANHSS